MPTIFAIEQTLTRHCMVFPESDVRDNVYDIWACYVWPGHPTTPHSQGKKQHNRVNPGKAGGVLLSAIWENTALVQWIRYECEKTCYVYLRECGGDGFEMSNNHNILLTRV